MFKRANARPGRTSLFGSGRPVPLCREAKTRVEHLARCLSRDRGTGEAYGSKITPKVLDVLHELLWRFHNAKSGLCFPSYEKIAEAAGVARSTVAEALKALERAGVISWVNRLVRRRDPLDGRVRVLRTWPRPNIRVTRGHFAHLRLLGPPVRIGSRLSGQNLPESYAKACRIDLLPFKMVPQPNCATKKC